MIKFGLSIEDDKIDVEDEVPGLVTETKPENSQGTNKMEEVD